MSVPGIVFGILSASLFVTVAISQNLIFTRLERKHPNQWGEFSDPTGYLPTHLRDAAEQQHIRAGVKFQSYIWTSRHRALRDSRIDAYVLVHKVSAILLAITLIVGGFKFYVI
jgi:hypothetical protein